MQEIASFITSCTKCDLSETRTHVVVGEGSLDAAIMFIGEAPGYHEDMPVSYTHLTLPTN